MNIIEVNYIIGIGRSGTTLLTSILGTHPEINTIPENYFVTFFYNSFKNKTYFKPSELLLIHEFNLLFNKLQPYIGYGYTLNKENDFLQQPFIGNYHELCKCFYKFFKHKTNHSVNAPIIIDKNPSNTLYCKKLLELNPNAKFIFITRDYRANILSRIESVHIRPSSVAYNAIRWNYFMSKALKFEKQHSNQVLKIKYEELVSHPENTLDRIFSFLKIEQYSTDNLQVNEEQAIVKDLTNHSSERLNKKYNDLIKPINTSRLDSWKTNLAYEQLILSDYICKRFGKKLGYKPQTKITVLKKTSLFIKTIHIRYRLLIEQLKDKITFYLPIKFKVNRFKKHIQRIETVRNGNSKK
ncbi:MAG: sulfotransferase [Flavobacteriales bacterium]|nr:sulfotransferase [Flavobacteriales bacterium]